MLKQALDNGYNTENCENCISDKDRTFELGDKEVCDDPKDRFMEILQLASEQLGIINELPEKCIKTLIEKRKDIDFNHYTKFLLNLK